MVEHANSSNFNDYISSGLTLVDFYANWCMPCKMLAPRVESVSEEMGNVAKFIKIDTDEAMDLAMRFGISAIPALYLFKELKISEVLSEAEKSLPFPILSRASNLPLLSIIASKISSFSSERTFDMKN